MLGRRDHERDAFVQLDPRQRGHPHVQEDAKEHGQRDEAQHVRHHDGHTWSERTESNLDHHIRDMVSIRDYGHFNEAA